MTRFKNTTKPAPPSTTTLAGRLHELISACFTALGVQTHEPQEAIRDITSLCRAESWRLGTWDCDRGMTFPLEPIQMPGVTDTQDPLAIIRALPSIANGSGTTLAVFENLHRFLGATELDLPPLNEATPGERILGGRNQGRARDATREAGAGGARYPEAPKSRS